MRAGREGSGKDRVRPTADVRAKLCEGSLRAMSGRGARPGRARRPGRHGTPTLCRTGRLRRPLCERSGNSPEQGSTCPVADGQLARFGSLVCEERYARGVLNAVEQQSQGIARTRCQDTRGQPTPTSGATSEPQQAERAGMASAYAFVPWADFNLPVRSCART